MRRLAVTLAAASFACSGSAPPPDPQGAQAAAPPESEAPVALNPDAPIAYPPALFAQNIEGEVVLRLFADSTGRLIPESTRVAESSNYPALDSAALAGSAKLRFAPAKRHGVPVATAFLQPVEFQHPGSSGPGTSLPPPTPTVPAPKVQAPVPAPTIPVARPRPDSIRPPTDTTRHPADTTRPPPRDTTRSRPDASGPAH